MSAAGRRFKELRQAVAEEVNRLVEDGCDHKSYEGTFEVIFGYPDAFEDPHGIQEPDCIIILHCYVFGPSRHYQWKGRTFAEALEKCEKSVRAWIKEGTP